MHSSVDGLLAFIDQSPTAFQAVEQMKTVLVEAGFVELKEHELWQLSHAGKYFVTRNDSSLIAFILGDDDFAQAGFKIIGAHTDSPHLKLKPNAAYEKSGYLQLGVEVYGGVLLASWMDRDLSLAGRVITKGAEGSHEISSVKIDRPCLRIPQLAIHLNREVNSKGLLLNKQSHLPPILSLVEKDFQSDCLENLLAKELDIAKDSILKWDLSLYDTQPASLGGQNNEFIFSARLDNLASCHAALIALTADEFDGPATKMIAFFDNEEVGSDSAQGAGSTFLKDVLERVALSRKKTREDMMRGISRSLFISADMAHAVHPNYADSHDIRHLPKINNGPVIKHNASQRYATDAVSSAYFETLCHEAGVDCQNFVMRTDLACGSTIGPITATQLGMLTVDIGNPMLSMHSIREMAGAGDHPALISVFKTFFGSQFKIQQS